MGDYWQGVFYWEVIFLGANWPWGVIIGRGYFS